MPCVSINDQLGRSLRHAIYRRHARVQPGPAAAARRIRAEAEQLAADKADRAEATQVLRDMETLRAW